MVREFQSVIGREARTQFRTIAGRDPRRGGRVRRRRLERDRPLLGVPRFEFEDEALRRGGGRPRNGGRESTRRDSRAASLGVLHGTRTMLLQDDAGQILPTHSVSAGLDYPAVGPEHARSAPTAAA